MARDEVTSALVDPLLLNQRSLSPPPTPAASSVGASSPSIPANVGSIDWSGQAAHSKGGSLSGAGSHLPRPSLSTSAGNSAFGSSQPSCRPWERSDLLRRLASFNPSNWSGKPKVVNALACARRGWMNVGVGKIACESCGTHLTYVVSPSWTKQEVDAACEAFARQLAASHKSACPWKGNSCAESLVQFPPSPPSAMVGSYNDRCDALLQFLRLPVVASSAIELMRRSRNSQIDRLLSLPGTSAVVDLGNRVDGLPVLEFSIDDNLYFHAQKLISLCGWEPRWLPNIVDCEEHSAQSARDPCSVGPRDDHFHYNQDPRSSKDELSFSAKIDYGKKKVSVPDCGSDSRLALLDCTLCGATVRLWDFVCIPRPARIAPNMIHIPETNKKLTRGGSAASGINGWAVPDGTDTEQMEGRDEAATTDMGKSAVNIGLDLNLSMGGARTFGQLGGPSTSKCFPDAGQGENLLIAQPSGSEVGDRAASFESHGPRTRKRSLDEGGSTVDRPQCLLQQADSVEGTVIDRDGDEVDDGGQYSGDHSKRVCNSNFFHTYPPSFGLDASCAGPSHSLGFDLDTDFDKVDSLRQEGSERMVGLHSARDSARASSVIAMDTVLCVDDDSMESVENYPGDVDDINFTPLNAYRNLEPNDVSEVNVSLQPQQSTCLQTEFDRVIGETGLSSTDVENITGTARDRFSFGISGGSVGMVASHEAEIHEVDVSVHRRETLGNELGAEVIENLGQTDESIPDPGLMDESIPDPGYDRQGDSLDMTFRSMGRADSGSKVDGSTKAESVESGQETSQTLGCDTYNAVIFSAYDVSKEEVNQANKTFINDDGVRTGGNNYVEGEFDPIAHHHQFCPWVNANVAAAGSCGDGPGTSSNVEALSGWQLMLDLLNTFQFLEHVQVQTVESESAASLYKDEQKSSVHKLFSHQSTGKGKGHY